MYVTLPMPAYLWPVPLYALLLALHLVLPARRVTGYVKDASGAPLTYRLNGLLVLVVAVGLWALAGWRGVVPLDALYVHRWEVAIGACVLGLVFSVAVVFTAPPVPGQSLLGAFYRGRLENPQWLGQRVDAKMFLYLVGAVVLELNLLSAAAWHVQHFESPSPGVLLYLALFSFFLVEYLFFERVHLYTYDLVAERVGFKLGWGCFAFYPFFYGVGLWALAESPDPRTPPVLLVLIALVFFVGWVLARGANLQKYAFKREPDKKAFGVLTQEALGGKVLVSGFWGVSRHVNYLGELLMASALALSLGYPAVLWPWLYPLYYLVLLVPRQRADDRRCAAQYGPLWDEYRRRVRWRIVPFVY